MDTNIQAISVTSEIGGYEYGATLTKPEDISRYFRLVFNDEAKDTTGKEWPHADDVIVDIIRRNPRQEGVDEEDYNDLIMDQMTEFDPQVLPDMSVQDTVNAKATDVEAQIEETAQLLNKNEKLLGLFQSIDTANKTVYMGPLRVYDEMLAMIGSGFDFFARIAEPGTHKNDIPDGSNVPWDKYTKYVISSSGTRRPKNFSQVDEIALRLTPIEQAIKSSETHKKAIAEKQAEALHKADKATDDTTKTLIKRNFRQAVGIIHKLKRMDKFTNLRVKIFGDKTGYKITPKPIHIWEADDATKTGAFTIVQFLSFQPQTLKADASLSDLIGSAEGRDSDNDQSDYPQPKKLEDMMTMTNVFASTLKDADMFKAMLTDIAKTPGSEFVSALRMANERLDVLLGAAQATEKTGTRDKLIEAAQRRASK